MTNRSLSLLPAAAPAARPDHNPGSLRIRVTTPAARTRRIYRFRQPRTARILLLVVSALAALTVTVSFHQRISAIKSESSAATAAASAARATIDAWMDQAGTREDIAAQKQAAMAAAVATIAGQLVRDASELTRSMLLPTVQLNGCDTTGSGTLVFSGVNPANAKTESYVLTSFHVVRNILADKPGLQEEGLDVTVYLPDGRVQVKGNMVAHDARIDAALIRLQTDRVFPFTAGVHARDDGPVKVWDAVCAVGCPLGKDPLPSHGEVSSLQNELNGANYWMINAPTYFGNSGGGVYLGSSRQLIGVFSKIYTQGHGNAVVVPHMGLCTPIDAIHEWLVEEGLGHLLQSRPHREPDLQTLVARIK